MPYGEFVPHSQPLAASPAGRLCAGLSLHYRDLRLHVYQQFLWRGVSSGRAGGVAGLQGAALGCCRSCRRCPVPEHLPCRRCPVPEHLPSLHRHHRHAASAGAHSRFAPRQAGSAGVQAWAILPGIFGRQPGAVYSSHSTGPKSDPYANEQLRRRQCDISTIRPSPADFAGLSRIFPQLHPRR